MRNWADYFDSNGLPCQSNKDGGDTAQRLGMLWVAVMYGKWFSYLGNFQDKLDELEVRPGYYIRNPTNYNQTEDFSRDQQVSLVIAMGMNGADSLNNPMRIRLTRLFKAHASRFFKYQNKDWAGPEHLGQYIRAFRNRWFYPFLWFSDIFMVGGVIVRCIYARNPDDVGDDLNLIIHLIQSKWSMPTLFSMFAVKLYSWLRPRGIQYALDWYFREEVGAPPINELYSSIVQKEFYGKT